jgi:hypothetical protein
VVGHAKKRIKGKRGFVHGKVLFRGHLQIFTLTV